MIEITDHSEGCTIAVHAQPGAKRNAIVGVHGSALKVAVSAPADKGRANEALIEVLANALGIKRGQIELVAGTTSRAKRFLIRGRKSDEVKRSFQGLAGQ